MCEYYFAFVNGFVMEEDGRATQLTTAIYVDFLFYALSAGPFLFVIYLFVLGFARLSDMTRKRD